MVEQPAVNRFVVGSSPTRGAECNGYETSYRRVNARGRGREVPASWCFGSVFLAISHFPMARAAAATRAISLAQNTKSGSAYVISNLGSSGQDVFKIRPTPLES